MGERGPNTQIVNINQRVKNVPGKRAGEEKRVQLGGIILG